MYLSSEVLLYTDLGLRRLYSILRQVYYTATPPMQLMETTTEPRDAKATWRLCLNARQPVTLM